MNERTNADIAERPRRQGSFNFGLIALIIFTLFILTNFSTTVIFDFMVIKEVARRDPGSVDVTNHSDILHLPLAACMLLMLLNH